MPHLEFTLSVHVNILIVQTWCHVIDVAVANMPITSYKVCVHYLEAR